MDSIRNANCYGWLNRIITQEWSDSRKFVVITAGTGLILFEVCSEQSNRRN